MKVYKYGLQPPTLNGELVHEEMKKAHAYQNKLIEIERWRRDQLRLIESRAGDIPQLELLLQSKEEVYNEINKLIKSGNAAARTKVASKDFLNKKKIAGAEVKEAKLNLKKARSLVRSLPEIKEAKDKLHKEALAKEREVRKSDEAPWFGTYMLIEKAVALTKAMPLYDGILPNNPRFRIKSLSSGRLGIQQFQPHEPLDKVLGSSPTSKSIQIVPLPSPSLKKNGKQRKIGKKDLRLLRVRIGTKDNKPIWAEFPMVYHRPLDGAIAMVQVLNTKIGPRSIWTVSITCNAKTKVSDIIKNEVAVDLGWRNYSDRVVIATYHGSDGVAGEVAIPLQDQTKYGLLQRLEYPNTIKSIRDKEFDIIRSQLVDWLTNNVIPEWLAETTLHLSQWKSKSRLSGLINKWMNNRFSGDESILGVSGHWNKVTKTVTPGLGLLGWKYHDYHLWQLETSCSVKSHNSRKELYRCIASQLANQYSTIIFEDIDGSNMAKSKIGSTNRQLTAPFEFRSVCKMIFTGRTQKYVEVPAAYTSMTCNACKHVNEKVSTLMITCTKCGEEYNRDRNAARNILEKYKACERSSDGERAASARNNDIQELPRFEAGSDLASHVVHTNRSQTGVQVEEIA